MIGDDVCFRSIHAPFDSVTIRSVRNGVDSPHRKAHPSPRESDAHSIFASLPNCG